MRTWEDVDALQLIPARLADQNIVGQRFFNPPQSWTVFDEITVTGYVELLNPQVRIVTPEDLKHPQEALHKWVSSYDVRAVDKTFDCDEEYGAIIQAAGLKLNWKSFTYRFEVEPIEFSPLDFVHIELRHDGWSAPSMKGTLDGKEARVSEPMFKMELIPVTSETLVAYAESRVKHQANWTLPKDW